MKMREPKGKERARDHPALHDGIPCKKDTRQESVLQERKTSRHSSFLKKKMIVPKEMLVITGIHLSVHFIKKGIPNLAVSVRFSKCTRLGRRTKET